MHKPLTIRLLGVLAAVVAVGSFVGKFTWAQSPAAMPSVGQPAPPIALPDQDGKVRKLSDYRGKVVLLAFYPADFTSGCTIEAHTMSAAYPKFVAAGIVPIGISVQSSASHKSFCTSAGIPYTLLADTQKKVTTEYGDLNPAFMGGIANRTTFIIGKTGRIAYVDAAVNSHLTTCAQEWIDWVTQHKDIVDGK